MKIGEFSRKFRVNKETIRYYTMNGLLTPLKETNHYNYNRECEKEMEDILLLKKMNFTINEIKLYLTCFRLSTRDALTTKDELIKLLCHKKNEINLKISEFESSKFKIEKKIEEIKQCYDEKNSDFKRNGVPLEFLNLLYCPKCKKKLIIKNGEIESNTLLSGQLMCNCGYKADISDGIIVFEGAELENLYEQKFEGAKYKKVLEKTEDIFNHEEMLPPEYLTVLTASLNWIHKMIAKEKLTNKVVLDFLTHSGILTNRLIDQLTEKNERFMFIAIDPRLQLVENSKKLFYMREKKPPALFLCGSYEKMPLKRESVDYLYSCFGSQSYGIYNKEFKFKKILSYLKKGGKWFELFFCTNKMTDIREEFQEIRQLLHAESLKDNLNQIKKTYFNETDVLKKKGELSFYFKEKAEVNLFSFIGEK